MNKNTRARFKISHKNARNGQKETQFSVPKTQGGTRSGGYVWSTFTVELTGKPDKNGVITKNVERNMQMRVLYNKGEDSSRNSSVTIHEPINRGDPFKPYKNKNYNKKLNAYSSDAFENTNEAGFVKIVKTTNTKK